MTQHIDLDALQAAAEAAGTEHPWHWHSDPIKGDPLGRSRYEVTTIGRTITRTYYSDDTALKEALFIAAANPAVVSALIARLKKAEAECELLRKKEGVILNAVACVVSDSVEGAKG